MFLSRAFQTPNWGRHLRFAENSLLEGGLLFHLCTACIPSRSEHQDASAQTSCPKCTVAENLQCEQEIEFFDWQWSEIGTAVLDNCSSFFLQEHVKLELYTNNNRVKHNNSSYAVSHLHSQRFRSHGFDPTQRTWQGLPVVSRGFQRGCAWFLWSQYLGIQLEGTSGHVRTSTKLKPVDSVCGIYGESGNISPQK